MYQSDGNLVVYAGAAPLWSSHTGAASAGRAIMQADGNLVVYSPTGEPLWDIGVARFHARYHGNGNGSDGGQVPSGLSAYQPEDTVPIALPRTMTRTSATFAYWTTKPDGTGSIFGWPSDMTMGMPTAASNSTRSGSSPTAWPTSQGSPGRARPTTTRSRTTARW